MDKSTSVKKSFECEFFEKGVCGSVTTDEDAKNARLKDCENINKTTCCYVCPYQPNCEVSCTYQGEKKCLACNSEMIRLTLNLRIDGMTGPWMLKVGDLLNISAQVLPVIAYSCPKCNKLELFTKKKAKL